jgi:hypothetical protein
MSIFEAPIVQTAEWKSTAETVKKTHWSMVLNRTYGGFRLSEACIQQLNLKENLKRKLKEKEKEGKKFSSIEEAFRDHIIGRDDPDLVSVVKALGTEEASGDVYGIKMKIEIIEFDLPSTQGFNFAEEDGCEHLIIFDLQKHAAGENPVIRVI